MQPFLAVSLGLLTGLALSAGLAVLGWRWWRRRRQIRWEDALKQACSAKHDGHTVTRAELAGRLGLSMRSVQGLSEELETAGLLRSRAGMLELTDAGERLGMHVLRGHRLWERYLSDEARMPLGRLHAAAERVEHRLDAGDLDLLAAHLGHPHTDPHGDPIPSASGKIAPQARTALTDWPSGSVVVVVHVEDEPKAVLARTLAAGLHPGTILRIFSRNAEAIVYEAANRTHTLSPADAAHVHVRAASEAERFVIPTASLAELLLGEAAEVAGLSERCTGLGRRRLLDLGFTPGARVEAVLGSPQDSAHAYRIRDTLIALRKEQAEQVLVLPPPDSGAEPASQRG